MPTPKADLRALVEAVREARAWRDVSDDGDHLRAIFAVERAEKALCDALLTSRAVEAVEVLRAWGSARANLRRVNDETWDQGRVGYVARRDAERAEGAPRRAVETLADALAGGSDADR